jgi:DNA-binding SARP family transcriptional activator/tetratricopeptide (TPR) repeat protein
MLFMCTPFDPVFDIHAAETIRYRLLGPVSAHHLGSPVRLSGRKQRTVLAALLLNANRVVSEEQLVDVLWEESPPSSARGQLQVRVSELRKLLGPSAIVRRAPGYLIKVEEDELDLDVFESSVAQARAELGGGNALLGIKQLREALGLWQGPPLGGVTDRMVSRVSQVLDERRTAVLEELFAAELAVGHHTEVIGELLEACGAHPFRERLQAQLMRALQHAGRAPEALEVYAQTRWRLKSELGIEPSAGLQQLQLDILNGQDERPGGGGDAADERATPGTIEVAVPAELPYDVRGFAGRTRELERLDAHLADLERSADGAADIWVVHGAAGVGKTAMAVHWAWRVRHHFPDGQLYVDLRGFDADSRPISPSVALAQLLRSLGMDPQHIPAELDHQTGLYRSLLADRRVLLLLDNAHDAEQVLPLLPPAGTVLVTSRQRLSELMVRAGARSLPLDVLVPKDSHALLSGVLGPDRIATETEPADELARLCGHLPLALRVAAANVNARPEPRIADLTAELAQGCRLAALTLDGADEGAVTRAFDASYAALSPALRRVFHLLALAPGADFTRDVAAALTGLPVDVAARRLTTLTAAHLIEQHTTDRFRFHDHLIREYALGKAQAEESAAACAESWNRLVEFYLATSDAANERFGRPLLRLPRDRKVTHSFSAEFPDSRAAAAWLDSERANLVVTLRQSVVRGPFPAAWYLADAVRLLADNGGAWAEWLEVADDILRTAQERDEPWVEALMRQSIGNTYSYLGRQAKAVDHLSAAIRVHRACGWLEGEVATVNALGIALLLSGRYAEAIEHFLLAAKLQPPTGNRIGEMTALSNLGLVYRQVGRLDEAERALMRSYYLAKQEGYRWVEAAALACQGFVWQLLGDAAAAEEILTHATAMQQELGSRYGVSYALGGLSLVRSDLGAHRQAREDALAALQVARQEGNLETALVARNALSRAEAALGLHDSAMRHQQQAVEAGRRSDSTWNLAEALTGLCALLGSSGDAEGAITAGREALRLARGSGLRPLEARSLLGLAAAHASNGEEQEAAALLRTGLTLSRERGFGALEAQARDLLTKLTGPTPP